MSNEGEYEESENEGMMLDWFLMVKMQIYIEENNQKILEIENFYRKKIARAKVKNAIFRRPQKFEFRATSKLFGTRDPAETIVSQSENSYCSTDRTCENNKNTKSGKLYKEDPTIPELINETTVTKQLRSKILTLTTNLMAEMSENKRLREELKELKEKQNKEGTPNWYKDLMK